MKTIVSVALLIFFLSCSDSDESKKPSSSDRTKFVGTWAGTYGCLGGAGIPDTLVISVGSGALDFGIIIHSSYANPDNLTGTLTDPNTINVPEQTMGGAPGTAEISLDNTTMTYQQTGFGITCGGTDYTKVP